MKNSLTICVGIIVCAASAAVAAPSYRFAFDQSDYQVALGGTVDVTVYLQETPEGGASVLDDNGVGMFGVGVTITDVAPLPSHPARVASTADITGVAAFNDPGARKIAITESPVIAASLCEATDFLSFVHADDSTPGQTDYFLTIGTFTYTASSRPGITYIQTGPTYDTEGRRVDVNATADLMILDAAISHCMATIATVPEPRSCMLLTLSITGAAMYHVWKWRPWIVTAGIVLSVLAALPSVGLSITWRIMPMGDSIAAGYAKMAEVWFDGIRTVIHTPEPSARALLGTLFGGLIACVWRKRNRYGQEIPNTHARICV